MRGGTLDIESFPGTWRTFADNTYEARLISEVSPNMPASYSFKPFRGKPVTRGIWMYRNPRDFMIDLWKVFDENQYIVGHNVKRFDRTQSNTFFAQFGLPAPSPCQYEDTMLIVKKHFRLPSYSLKYCLQFFEIGAKMETGGDSLWKGAEQGNVRDQAKMLRYNRNDTVQTDKLWLYLANNGWVTLPWAKVHTKNGPCPRCKGTEWMKRGVKPMVQGLTQYYSCKQCNKQLPGEVIQEWSARIDTA
jgi:hypothetical protein